MKIRAYPYTAWVLNQLDQPKRVKFYEAASSPGRFNLGDVAKKGKVYLLCEIFPTKEAALLAAQTKQKGKL
jgi:hypothetical protein